MDPSMRLFEYDKKSLLASIPAMYAFPKVCFVLPRGLANFILAYSYTMYTLHGSRRSAPAKAWTSNCITKS